MARVIGRGGPVKVAIADDSGLIYSDDYRLGWEEGFRGIGCEVRVFDVKALRRVGSYGPYSSAAKGLGKHLAQNIAAWNPTLVWAHHGRAASRQEFVSALRARGIPTAVYLCDEPYEVGETARFSPSFDAVFTMDPCTLVAHQLARVRAAREHVFYLPPAASDRFVRRPYFHNQGFVRNQTALFLGNADLIPRRAWLEPIERLVDGADIRFWPHKERKPVAKGHPKWVPAEAHPELYASCMVGLNVHRDPGITEECFRKRVVNRSKNISVPSGMTLCEKMPLHEGTGFWNDPNLPAAHLNPRFFEMAACGTLVVSDDSRSELKRMFPMAPRAQDPEHFLELVNYYMDHAEEAEEIGEACSYLISRQHRFRHRAGEVLIRLGLMGSLADNLSSCLGEPTGWLTPQDSWPPTADSLSDPTGHSERWNPRLGMSLTRRSGRVSEARSIDSPTPWL